MSPSQAELTKAWESSHQCVAGSGEDGVFCIRTNDEVKQSLELEFDELSAYETAPATKTRITFTRTRNSPTDPWGNWIYPNAPQPEPVKVAPSQDELNKAWENSHQCVKGTGVDGVFCIRSNDEVKQTLELEFDDVSTYEGAAPSKKIVNFIRTRESTDAPWSIWAKVAD